MQKKKRRQKHKSLGTKNFYKSYFRKFEQNIHKPFPLQHVYFVTHTHNQHLHSRLEIAMMSLNQIPKIVVDFVCFLSIFSFCLIYANNKRPLAIIFRNMVLFDCIIWNNIFCIWRVCLFLNVCIVDDGVGYKSNAKSNNIIFMLCQSLLTMCNSSLNPV